MIEKALRGELAGLDDKELWLNFRYGRKDAFECIYLRYVRDLFNFGMKLNGNRPLVKDCIQELFVEIWNRRDHLSNTDNIKFYLFKALKIKLNHARKQEQKERTQFTASPELSAAMEGSYEQNVIEEQISAERSQQLLQALDRLPERQKEALQLLFFENLSYEQVSELMSINVSSAYTLAWKAIKGLKKRLKIIILLILIPLI